MFCSLRSRGIRFYALAFSLLLMAPAALAGQAEQAEQATLPDGIERVASVEGITEYELDNGLQVLLFPDRTKQQITVNITYFVGSRHESYGETGMAHLLEHLVFKGTPDHPDIPQELTERGAFPNGTTWFDRTNYFETFTATEDNLAWALDLEADRMVNSFISADDLESEMTVVRNEWEAGENSPFGVLMKRLQSAAYDWHNYGNSTIGARSDIENVPIDRLKAFYEKYYQPDNAVLIVAGAFETDRALELIAQEFGSIPRPERTGANQLFETYTAEPAQDGERTVTLRRVGDEKIVVTAYHIPPGSHEDYAAVEVLSHILGTEPAGRLHQGLVETGLAANSGAAGRQLREPGLLMAYARVRESAPLEPAADSLIGTLRAIASDQPPTEEEVQRAKNEYLKNIELSFNNPQGIALRLSEWTSMGDWRLFFLHRDRLEQVTPDAVRRVAATYLIPTNRTMGYFYPVDETPTRAEVPQPPDVATLVANYEGRDAIAEGEAFDPTPSNIESRTQRVTLDNGFELAMLPKETRGNNVSANFTLRFGTEAALMGRATEAGLVAAMLRRGTETRTRQEIEDELDRLKAQLFFGSGATSVGGQIRTVRESLPEVMRLLSEMLTEPSFPENEFATLKEERLVALESQMAEPQARAFTAFQRHMNQHWPEDHPNYTPTLEEQKERLEAVTLEEVRTFWEDFYGAQDGTMSIVGDFDAEEMQAMAGELFGGWNSPAEYVRIEDPYRPIDAVETDIETPDKTNAMMVAAQPVQMKDTDEDYPAMVLGNYMLGGGFLNSRLAERIRQEEGLSYGVGSQFGAGALDDSGIFLTYAIFAPENSDAVVAAFRDVLGQVLSDGFTEDEIAAAKRGWLDRQQNSRADDGSVAGQLNGQLFIDRTYEYTTELEQAVAGLTADQILGAMQEHIDPSSISIIRAGDFAGVEAEAPTS